MDSMAKSAGSIIPRPDKLADVGVPLTDVPPIDAKVCNRGLDIDSILEVCGIG
jgi:hypothetical protein